MKIKQLLLQNFRNIHNLEMNCHPNINVIFGDNGQGKSNLLESISCLSVGKSFRVSSDKPLLSFDKDFFYLKSILHERHGENKVELAYDGSKKKAKINGDVKTKLIDFIGTLKTVSFIPEDLNLVKEGSSGKRRFVDLLLCQISKKYAISLASYQKVLDQRNKILKEKPAELKQLLDAWDLQLAQFAIEITQKRKEIFEALNPELNNFFKKISQTEDHVTLSYSSSLELDSNEYTLELCVKKLKEKRQYDIIRGFTTIGPHRDEIHILFNNRDSKIYASQGQQRLIAFSLKMAEIKVIENITNEKPILLLDDIFSELDEKKINNILSLLQEEERQTFITTAYPIQLSAFEHQVFTMNKGVLNISLVENIT